MAPPRLGRDRGGAAVTPTFDNGVSFAEWESTLKAELIAVDASLAQLHKNREEIDERIAELDGYHAELCSEEALRSQANGQCTARLTRRPLRAGFVGPLWEILVKHFAGDDGTIVGKDAVNTLVRLGYFANNSAAAGAVYTNLRKPVFVKVRTGVYAISTESEDWTRLRT